MAAVVMSVMVLVRVVMAMSVVVLLAPAIVIAPMMQIPAVIIAPAVAEPPGFVAPAVVVAPAIQIVVPGIAYGQRGVIADPRDGRAIPIDGHDTGNQSEGHQGRKCLEKVHTLRQT